MLFVLILNVPSVILSIQNNLLPFWISFFYIIFLFCKLIACHNIKRMVKYPLVCSTLWNTQETARNILVLYVIIIFYVNLHGNPSFSLVYKNITFEPSRGWQTNKLSPAQEGDRIEKQIVTRTGGWQTTQTNCHPHRRVTE